MNLTVAEAEALLGRPLSWIEDIWVRHMAGWTNFQLYCLTFFILVVGYIVGSAPFLVLDFLRLPFFEKYRLQPQFHNKTEAVLRCFKSVMVHMFTVILPLQLLSGPFMKLARIHGELPLPTLWEAGLQLAVFFIVEDYGNYWIHRWLHLPGLYERIHAKHHEFLTPMSFSASYATPAEILLLGIPSFVGPALVRCHVVTMWAWIVLRQLEAVETHSGYHFPWSITRLIPFYGGAEYHDYHHFVGGDCSGNFASIFTYCDAIYGTDKGYRFRKEAELKRARALADDRARAGLGFSAFVKQPRKARGTATTNGTHKDKES